jgi:hypothetical protein
MQVFISYSHKDRRLCDECKTHLAALSRVERVEAWRDDRILAGQALSRLRQADAGFRKACRRQSLRT